MTLWTRPPRPCTCVQGPKNTNPSAAIPPLGRRERMARSVLTLMLADLTTSVTPPQTLPEARDACFAENGHETHRHPETQEELQPPPQP